MLEAIHQNSGYSFAARFQSDPQVELPVSALGETGQGQGVSKEEQTSRDLPGQKNIGSDGQQKDSVELSQEAEEIRKLQVRDQEVRAHEAAHASAGGAYAGSPTYSFERGPDGRIYAVGGEVSIDVSPISGDPEATLQKAQQVRAAALAPAEPSGQDLKVAQRAEAMAAKARMEVSQQMTEELKSTGEKSAEFSVGQSDVGKIQQAGQTSRNQHISSINSPSTTTVSRLDIRA